MKSPALLRVTAPVRGEVMRMVGPVMLEQLIISSMGIVGTVLASRLGKEAIMPIGMVDQLHFLFILFFTSIAAGATVVVAQHTGRGELDKANEATRQAMATSLAISVVLVVLLALTGMPLIDLLYGRQRDAIRNAVPSYLIPSLLSYPPLAVVSVGCGVLRGAGDTRTPMIITVMMGILNAILSALLIYGVQFQLFGIRIALPALEIKGAALALLVSRLFASVLIGYVLLRGQRSIKMSLKGFRVNMDLQRSILSIGVPMTAESLLFQVGKLITGVIIVKCGEAHMNANVIAGSIFSLICIPGNAFSIAAMPLVGQSVGRGAFDEARDKLLFVNWLSSLGLAVTCAAMFVFARPLVGLYTTDESVIPIAISMIQVIAVTMPLFWSVSFVLPAGLKGASDAKYSMITTVTGMWLFRVLLGYILGVVMGWGAVGIYVSMSVDWAVRGTLYYIRVRGTRWYQHAQRKILALQNESQ